MLYSPPAFTVDELGQLHEHIDHTGLALLISNGPNGPLASHVPLLLDRQRGPQGTLVGHLARANPHWQQADPAHHALVVFQGPDAYITPSWYASKQEHGRVVPTWNYAVVHARGPLQVFEEADRLLDVVSRLTDRHEAARAAPWAVSDAPEKFIDAQLRGIVGIEIEIAALQGKYKLSQNRPPADRDGVIAGLGAEQKPGAEMMAEMVAKARDSA